jgi:hypothetical protein
VRGGISPARLRSNLLIALSAVLVFQLVSFSSGKLDAVQGLGWDGFIYGRMVTGELANGSPNARMRPLVVLIARVPHYFGAGVRESFELLNYAFAFGLYLTAALLLQHYGLPLAARATIVLNLALTISTSKMFAFYPTQVDLGALAFTTVAFYLAATDRRRVAGAACVLACASREFGIATVLYGIHRTIRQGGSWKAAAVYLPGLATFFLIRWWSSSLVGAGDPLSPADAIQNLAFWTSPAFTGAFAYFAATVFGGVSVVLVARARWCIDRLRDEPELATFLAVIVGLSVAGHIDIWRYLAFALPAALVLIARFCREQQDERRRAVVALITLCTVLTQRPFEQMDAVLYFRDWFPLYHVFGVHASRPDLGAVWAVRGLSLVLLLIAVHAGLRQTHVPSRAVPLEAGALSS